MSGNTGGGYAFGGSGGAVGVGGGGGGGFLSDPAPNGGNPGHPA
jgi:hypothetical protein